MANSFKAEVMQGAHCFNATVTATASGGASGAYPFSIAATGGIAVGMAVSGTGIGTGAVVAAITSTTVFVASVQNTATVSGTLTFTGDVFKMALFKAAPAQTYDGTLPVSQQYALMAAASDETSGTGYTATGTTLGNVTAVVNSAGSPQGVVNFSPNPSWTTATFSTSGCMIYNTTPRMSDGTYVAGRVAGVYSFGGTQTVSTGTFSVVMPSAVTSNSAILQIR
jgi:hypothetical protein